MLGKMANCCRPNRAPSPAQRNLAQSTRWNEISLPHTLPCCNTLLATNCTVDEVSSSSSMRRRLRLSTTPTACPSSDRCSAVGCRRTIATEDSLLRWCGLHRRQTGLAPMTGAGGSTLGAECPKASQPASQQAGRSPAVRHPAARLPVLGRKPSYYPNFRIA